MKRPGGGRPRKRPGKLHAYKGYDFARCREALRERSIEGRTSSGGGNEKSVKPGRHRWMVERSLS